MNNDLTQSKLILKFINFIENLIMILYNSFYELSLIIFI
jgi:hypothetical protein